LICALSGHPGAIFDLDGVLTDTAEFHYRVWQRLADEEGLPFNRQANAAGVSRRESMMQIVADRQFLEAKNPRDDGS